MGRNAMEIMSWTTDFMKQYWRLGDGKVDHQILNAYRREAMSGNYHHLIDVSAELILEHTGIQLDCSYLIRDISPFSDGGTIVESMDDPDFVGDDLD